MSYIKIVCVKYLFILFYTLNKFFFLKMLTLLYVIMKNVKHGSEFIYIYIYMLSWGVGIRSSNSQCLYKKHQKMSFDLHKIGQSWLLVILMKLIRWKLWIDQSCKHITSKIESIWFQNIIPHNSYRTIFVNGKLSIYDRKMLKLW